MEKCNGEPPYNQLFQSHPVPDTTYCDGLWREPAPGDFNTPYGLAAGYHTPGQYAWLSTPNGVWRALLTIQTMDISPEVASLEMETGERQGRLSIELNNQDNRFTDSSSLLASGSQLEVFTGYRTATGNEAGSCRSFILDSYEQIIIDADNIIRLKAGDGWAQIKEWHARDQWRWNKAGQEKSVRDILAFVLSRAGLRLETRTESTVITGLFPDFTIHPLDSGDLVAERLLDMVPDRLFFENGTAYLVNPQASDSPGYGYGEAHPIWEGKFFRQAGTCNWIRVEGFDPSAGRAITSDCYDWTDIKESGTRYLAINDINLKNLTQLEQRGEMLLRKARMKSVSGLLIVPVNCGQELYDVVDITDARGFTGIGRITGMTLKYDPARGRYLHQLMLGGV